MSEEIKGSGIIYTDGKKALLLRRAGGKFPGKWFLPGGHIEEGESPLEAAKRESEEEIGRVEGNKFDHIDMAEYRLFFFEVDKPFVPTLNPEHDDYRWMPFDEISSLDLIKSMRTNLARILATINKRFCETFKEWMACHQAEEECR